MGRGKVIQRRYPTENAQMFDARKYTRLIQYKMSEIVISDLTVISGIGNESGILRETAGN